MHLPDAEHATIAREKITEYLLLPEHRDNKGKAAFFFRYGFTMDAWETLAAALVAHGKVHPITDTRPRPQGTLYSGDGRYGDAGWSSRMRAASHVSSRRIRRRRMSR